MKTRTIESTYAHALYESLRDVDNPEERTRRFNNFLDILDKRSHQTLLPQITQEFEKRVRDKEKEHTIEIVTSEVKTEEEYRKLLARELSHIMNDNHEWMVDTYVDPHLIGGFTILANDTYIDASYKTKLLKLYKECIN